MNNVTGVYELEGAKSIEDDDDPQMVFSHAAVWFLEQVLQVSVEARHDQKQVLLIFQNDVQQLRSIARNSSLDFLLVKLFQNLDFSNGADNAVFCFVVVGDQLDGDGLSCDQVLGLANCPKTSFAE